jgi:hypothetical protein
MTKEELQKILERKVSKRPLTPAAPMDLSGEAGRRIIMAAAKRVMATHADVIKALAKR